MSIGGISDYNQLFANYKIKEIPSVDLEQVISKKQPNEQIVPVEEPLKAQNIDLSIEEKRQPVKQIDINDISLTFNANEDFGYLGKDSDINDLDMQKAISDMKKDQVLEQYQYFVGSSENLISKANNQDGFVFLKY